MTKLIVEYIDNYKPARKLRGPYHNCMEEIKDPSLHEYYQPFCFARSQANRRGEGWFLSFQEWYAAWGEDIDNRGTTKGSKSMTRIDIEKSWKKDNIMIVDRSELRSKIMKEFWSNKNG